MNMMIKRLLPGLLLAACLTTPAMAQTRIATVDLKKVFDSYWKRQQAEAAIKEHGAALEKEDKAYQDDFQKTKDDYTKLVADANDQSITPEERDKRKSAAEAKLLEVKTSQNTIQTFEANARDTLESQKKRMRDAILQDIKAAVEAKAKAGGFSLVIDTAAASDATGTTMVLYSNGDNDMTDAILTQLNAGAPAATDTSKPDSTPGGAK
jgi:outer membrane protein